MDNSLLDTIIQSAYDKGFKDGYSKAVETGKCNYNIESIDNNLPTKLWLSPKDILAEFDIALSSQAKMRMQRKIPYHKIGKFVRYKRTDINIWFDSGKVV